MSRDDLLQAIRFELESDDALDVTVWESYDIGTGHAFLTVEDNETYKRFKVSVE